MSIDYIFHFGFLYRKFFIRHFTILTQVLYFLQVLFFGTKLSL